LLNKYSSTNMPIFANKQGSILTELVLAITNSYHTQVIPVSE